MKPKMNYARISRTVSLLSLIVCVGTARAQTPTFTYQGSLTDAGSPANGTYEMQFSLFGSLAGNDQIGSTITNSSVAVANGVFTVQLDFSPATPFATGDERWLAMAVRKVSGPPGFTTLTPRQQITSSPYSIRTLSAKEADSLSSQCVGCVGDANVSDTITVGASSTVSDSALSAQVARLNGAQTITGNWVNTANPWADNEVTDALTINGGTVNNTVIGGITSAAGTFTTLALNGGAGTNIVVSKSGVDRSSAVSETFNIQNSGTGAMTLQVDGSIVVTTSNENFVNTAGDTMTGNLTMTNAAIINMGSSAITNVSSLSGGGTVIDFTNFDVAANGNVTAAGNVSAGGGLSVGGGTSISSIRRETVSVPGNPIAANSCTDFVGFTAATEVVGADVAVGSPSAPTAGLIWMGYVSSGSEVKLRVCNVTNASITPPATTFTLRIFTP